MNNRIQSFLDEINANVRYCHWKSNMDISGAQFGVTDFDLLIDKNSKHDFECIASKFGFNRATSVTERQIICAEDWVYFCSFSNTVIHIHAHYELWIGAKNNKSFSIPFIDNILRDRRFEKDHNLWCSSYEHEFILIVLRLLLRQTFFQRKGAFDTICKNQSQEFTWLYQKQDPGTLKTKLNECGLSFITETLMPNNRAITFAQINRSLSAQTLRSLSGWQVESPLFVEMRRLSRLVKIKVKLNINRNFGSWLYNTHRFLDKPGPIIAIIGIDGAGKSTIVEHCFSIISKKVDCENVYFGHGMSGGALYRLSFLFCVALSLILPFWRDGIHGTRVLFLRYVAYKIIKRASAKGKIVLVDRWPQVSYAISDGPIFQGDDSCLSILEKRLNRKIDCLNVSLVLLDVPVSLAMKRKKMDYSTLAAKNRAVHNAKFLGSPGNIIKIPIRENTSIDKIVSGVLKSVNDAIG